MGKMYKDITGIILSGGKSSRMGENKSFLKIGNMTVIERTVNLMRSLFDRVIIISNEPELYFNLNVEIFTDIYKDVGPLAGIHSGLKHSFTENIFVISCDIPLMNSDMIKSIIEYPGDSFIKVPLADGYIQFLCGIYPKKSLQVIEEIITNDFSKENRSETQEKRKCKMTSLINTYPSIIIDEITNLNGYFKEIFFNMNNKNDYKQIIELLNK